MADAPAEPELVASFFTLTGQRFRRAAAHAFAERCRAAADGRVRRRSGMHAADLPRTVAAGLDVDGMRAVLAEPACGSWRSSSWAAGRWTGPDTRSLRPVAGIEAVADAFGGRHVARGSSGPAPGRGLDLDAAAARLRALAARLAGHGLQVALEAFPWSALRDAGRRRRPAAAGPNAARGADGRRLALLNGGGAPSCSRPARGHGGRRAAQRRPARARRLPAPRARRRMLPGEGDLDVVELVRAVRRTGSPAVVRRVSTPRVQRPHGRRGREAGGRRGARRAGRGTGVPCIDDLICATGPG